jgi:hypothetical protein
MALSRVTIIALICLGLTTAAAQQREAVTAAAACNASTRGTLNCPTYTVPAATAVQHASMDGSMTVPNATSTLLFNGAVPPNGFMVQSTFPAPCWVNDNGPASNQAGFSFGGNGNPFFDTFITPPGYKPIGAVSIWCGSGNPTVSITARGW